MDITEPMSSDPRPNYFPPEPPAVEPLTLRAATLADAPALALVGAATFLEAYTWMLPGPDILAFCAEHQTPAAYAKYLAQPTTRITLALTGADVPVGFTLVCAPELPSIETLHGDFELKRIYLFSRFRSSSTPVLDGHGQPIPGLRGGQALLNAAIADARTLGAHRLLLGTNAGNQRAIAFYRRNGFQEIGTRTFIVGNQCCCDLLFALSL
jgi:ribosomal protein S18 acetylase RimI-like enzyme